MQDIKYNKKGKKFSNNVMRVGDSVVYEKRTGVRGCEIYQEERKEARKEEALAVKQSRETLNKMFVNWNAHYTIQDLNSLATLESAASRNKFKILLVSSDRDCILRWTKVAQSLRFLSVYSADSFKSAKYHLDNGDFNLVLCSHELGDGCGRYLHEYVRDLDSEHFIHFMIINGFTKSQRIHLNYSDVPVLKDPPTDVNIEKLMKSFYGARLVEIIEGDIPFLQGIAFNEELIKLERQASKALFNIMIVDDQDSLRDYIGLVVRNEGFPCLTECKNVTSAKTSLEQRPVDLILCDYRMPEGDGNELFDHLQELRAMGVQVPQFIMVSGYIKEEMLHLKRKGIILLDKLATAGPRSFEEGLKTVVKGFYVMHLRKIIKGEL